MLTSFENGSIIDVWRDPECAFKWNSTKFYCKFERVAILENKTFYNVKYCSY